jgi:hypothetical protein
MDSTRMLRMLATTIAMAIHARVDVSPLGKGFAISRRA